MIIRSHKIKVALFEPRIPQNTGNIGRTCAAFKISLDLIKPLGFSLDSKQLKRAGLDYWDFIDLQTHQDFSSFKNHISGKRLIGFSKRDGIPINQTIFTSSDVLLFGREDIGLPDEIRQRCDLIVSIPMPGRADEDGCNGVRSLNLSSACAIASYAALANQIY